jgi:lysophospholipase L1-like esterase
MTYLALGDSYTIGEAVQLHESFPYQVVQLLRREHLAFNAPEIIAKTGWTTDELLSAISFYRFESSYDFVTLLIGVNNQYRERSCEEYQQQFTTLLKKAIRLSGNVASHVIVLSIPDWGITPFAKDRDRKKIGEEIDQFNLINKKVAKQQGTHYIDITSAPRNAVGDVELLAADGLHPSTKEYRRWAGLVVEMVKRELNK